MQNGFDFHQFDLFRDTDSKKQIKDSFGSPGSVVSPLNWQGPTVQSVSSDWPEVCEEDEGEAAAGGEPGTGRPHRDWEDLPHQDPGHRAQAQREGEGETWQPVINNITQITGFLGKTERF